MFRAPAGLFAIAFVFHLVLQPCFPASVGRRLRGQNIG